METTTLFTSDQDVESQDTALEPTSHQLKEALKKLKRLKSLYNYLLEDLDEVEAEVHILRQEQSSLLEENKSLQEEKAKLRDLLEEAESLELSLETSNNSENTAHPTKKEPDVCCEDKEFQEILKEEEHELLHEICISELENKSLREDVTILEQEVLELECNLNAKTLELREMDNNNQESESVIKEMTVTLNDYISTKEDLKNTIQELECQLEESLEELAMRKEIEERAFMENRRASDTIMCEIIQIDLEKQLVQAQMKKQQGQGIQGVFCRFLYNMALEFLWNSFSVGIFFLLSFFFLQVFHTIYPDYLLLDLRCLFSDQTVEVLQNILYPFMKLKVLGPVPT
ncbi:uncharacterized protein ACNLHF_011098 [Anomaloglossus baeobatrachus]|uniref:uncharacterized protein LOC142282932 n=1 Tax=Anomaloglossus baeobatrachus TaxID=238106 RepID=UPI003F4FD4DB